MEKIPTLSNDPIKWIFWRHLIITESLLYTISITGRKKLYNMKVVADKNYYKHKIVCLSIFSQFLCIVFISNYIKSNRKSKFLEFHMKIRQCKSVAFISSSLKFICTSSISGASISISWLEDVNASINLVRVTRHAYLGFSNVAIIHFCVNVSTLALSM